jgi:UPF0755 protein
MGPWFLRSIRNRFFLLLIASFVLPLLLYSSYIWKNFNYVPVKSSYTLTVASGDTISKIAKRLVKQKVLSDHKPIILFAKLYRLEKKVCIGEYAIESGATGSSILKNLVAGNVTRYAFTIVEGSNFKDIVKNLHTNPKLAHTLVDLSIDEIKQRLEIVNYSHVEGLFLPDTYYFTANSTDVELLLRAKHAMEQKLAILWNERDKSTILKDPYEALILASIIQKESHIIDEYKQVSGVYHRRLEKKIRLQADPTVIYGMQDEYSGKLYIKDLKHESEFNTYRKFGLPPAPIAMPCLSAIEAALNPSNSTALYFVAIGDGKHKFSQTLAEHNEAVAVYRKRKSSNNNERSS